MFVLAEPKDVVIICGEFNSGVEIINESREPEQVFTVTKIIQHPDYKPTTVRKQKIVFYSNLIPVLHLRTKISILSLREAFKKINHFLCHLAGGVWQVQWHKKTPFLKIILKPF